MSPPSCHNFLDERALPQILNTDESSEKSDAHIMLRKSNSTMFFQEVTIRMPNYTMTRPSEATYIEYLH